MRLVWVSRHELNEKNKEILSKAFGHYEVYQYKDTVNNVSELIEFADSVDADAYVVVLPINLIADLIKADNRPIYRFIVNRILKDDGSVEFVPVGLEKIVKVELVTEKVV